MTPIEYAVPGSRYEEFMLRESAMLAAVAAVAAGFALLVVARRRPY